MFTEPISILRTANLVVPIVLCDAEQIILPEILIRLWRIAYDKKGLVNRIESRIDVDWLPSHSSFAILRLPTQAHLAFLCAVN